MATDPSAARDLLQTYTGPDLQRLDMLRAEARGRGTSILLGRPHGKHLMLVRALDDGTVLSVGEDGTVTKTSLAGVTRTIAHDVAQVDAAAFSPEHHLLAYACDNAAVCLLDTRREAPVAGPARALHPLALALSPDASRLAVVSTTGALTVWQLGDAPALQVEVQSERSDILRFADDDTLIHAAGNHVHIFGVSTRVIDVVGDIKAIDVAAHAVALGTSTGHVVVIDSRSGEVVSDHQMCDRVRAVLAIDAHRIAYGCNDGSLGMSQLLMRASSRIDTLAFDGASLYAGTKTGQIVAYNFATRLSATYAAHTNDVLTLQVASPSFPYLTSSDFEDNIRVWSLPEPSARLALQASGPLVSAAWLPNRDALVAWGRDDELDWLDHGQLVRSNGHAPEHTSIAISPRGQLALFRSSDEVELWSTDAHHVRGSFRTGHGATYDAAFVDGGAALLTGSEDGALTLTRDGVPTELAKLDAVPYALRECGDGGSVAIADWSGGLWLYEHQRVRFVARSPGSFTGTDCSRDGKTLAITGATGDLRLYDLATGRDTLLASGASPLRFPVFSPDGSQLLAITNRELHVFRVPGTNAGANALPDRLELPPEVQYVTPSLDGQWLAAVCNNGDLWFYRRATGRWIYRATGTAKLESGRFSEDSSQFATADAAGRLLLFDLRATRSSRAANEPQRRTPAPPPASHRRRLERRGGDELDGAAGVRVLEDQGLGVEEQP